MHDERKQGGKFLRNAIVAHTNGLRFPKNLSIPNATLNRHDRRRLARQHGITWDTFRKWERDMKLTNKTYYKG